jgi:hypothetical protein
VGVPTEQPDDQYSVEPYQSLLERCLAAWWRILYLVLTGTVQAELCAHCVMLPKEPELLRGWLLLLRWRTVAPAAAGANCAWFITLAYFASFSGSKVERNWQCRAAVVTLPVEWGGGSEESADTRTGNMRVFMHNDLVK